MNSNLGNFDFDLGIGSNNRSSKPLNQQKPNSSYSNPKPTPSWQPGKPSWTHQPAPAQPSFTRTELGGPASLVGDITGKNWNSTAPAARAPQTGVAAVGAVGIVNKNPNLFGDLVSSAIGKNVGSSNAPLKSVTPAKSSFSMGGVASSLPKTNAPDTGYVSGINYTNSAKNVGGSQSFGGLGSGIGSGSNNFGGYGGVGVNKGSGAGLGMGMGAKKDPFVSLVNFSSNPSSGGGGIGSVGKGGSAASTDDFGFGEFQNAAKPNSTPMGSIPKMDGFGDFQNASQSNSNPLGSVPKMNDFGSGNQASVQSSMGTDSFDDMFFTSAPASGGSNAVADGGDDWGFGGEHDGGGTTELDGLPAPPPGVSASSAKGKGLENYKAGQFADAIKWLSWAEVLLGKAGDTAGTMEVLTCKASCYKEVGEYKKAVADCTKILDHDGENVAALVQRALLYESMEKYRLGAEDLRTVMKLDPGNRVARSTIHRLTKMAD